jgi:hypothetical protein
LNGLAKDTLATPPQKSAATFPGPRAFFIFPAFGLQHALPAAGSLFSGLKFKT